MRFFSERKPSVDRRRSAATYVRTLLEHPASDDVAWLAATAAGGDLDHATWEWRYARRAIGLLIAQRDALDDLTPSLVAQELADASSRDPNVAADLLPLAERQFNERLAAYRDALASRSGEALGVRLGRILLAFTGTVRPKPEVLARAAESLARYADTSSSGLASAFGAATLPEDVPPSAAGRI